MNPFIQKIMNQVREENPEPLYEGLDDIERIIKGLEYLNMIGEETIRRVQEKYKEQHGEYYVFKAKRRENDLK